MSRALHFAAYWPVPIVLTLCAMLMITEAAEQVELPGWLIEAFTWSEAPAEPEPEPVPEPTPEALPGVPYAPAPGRDDRTPLAFLSHVFGLGDPDLPAKLSGIGPTFWKHGGQGTGALIARDVVLTTGHLFAKDGKWHGPGGLSPKPPAPSDGKIYLAACDRSYTFKAIHMGSMAPRERLGLDYAIAELTEPACNAAAILPVAHTPDDLSDHKDQIFLNVGSYRWADVARYAKHPLFEDRGSGYGRYAVFGVKCQPVARADTGDIAGRSTAVIVTSGCDGIPGGSGGPVVLSRDGGASYSIVGVANSYRKTDPEFNNYTRIEGAFATHLAEFVTLEAFAASGAMARVEPTLVATFDDWLPLSRVQTFTKTEDLPWDG